MNEDIKEAIGLLTYKVNMSNTDVYIGDLDKTNIEAIKVVLREIERLQNIIKEVREKIEKAIIKSEIEGNSNLNVSELLEILDKDNNEKI